ncbi:MAG: phosphate ABC transporter ATP-binding protein [Candidatus Marinimicrobia bacterium]|nr:phosphate ABC transporter ATP-binding protein [Candidatus Neomarinimicrobiota bacterium]
MEKSSQTPLFQIKNVSKRPPQADATNYILQHLNFDILSNEIFTILGPSGSGKSTLLRLLNALDDPSEGEIRFDGIPLEEIDIFDLRRRVAMVFQQPALLPGTVEENLDYPRKSLNSQTTDRSNEELLDIVGLSPELLSRDSQALSLGQQQRVMIARALVSRPEVLLMDEPTSALDPTATKRILNLTKTLQQDYGLTIVFVTHNMPEAKEIANRVLLLVDGESKVVASADSFFSGETGELAKRFLAGELEG